MNDNIPPFKTVPYSRFESRLVLDRIKNYINTCALFLTFAAVCFLICSVLSSVPQGAIWVVDVMRPNVVPLLAFGLTCTIISIACLIAFARELSDYLNRQFT